MSDADLPVGSSDFLATAALREGHFDGPTEFAQRIRDAIAQAHAQGWSAMVWADADFGDWPLGERQVVEALQAWSQRGRTLRLLARRYDYFPQRFPRFVTWRQQWDHIIECRVCRPIPELVLPSVLWTSQYAVLRIDTERSIGWSGTERQRLALVHADLDEYHKNSSPGFPSTTLGL